MKPFYFLLLLIACNLFSHAKAQESLQIRGSIFTDNRVFTQSNLPWSWNENRLDVQLEQKLEGKARVMADVWLRNFGYPVGSEAIIDPEVREAYIEVYDFLIKGLDIRAGRQRIKWGTADKINPTDVINPYDAEDIWDFGRHLGSEAIDLKYYRNKWRFEAVWVPYFRKARLPLGEMKDVFMNYGNIPGAILVNVSDTLPLLPFGLHVNSFSLSDNLPSSDLIRSGSWSFKAGLQIFGFDFSLSYQYIRDGFPLPASTKIGIDSIDMIFPFNAYLNTTTTLVYPRFHVAGLDLAGSIGNIGIWFEAAAFFPQDKIIHTIVEPDMKSFVLENYGLDLDIQTPVFPDNTVLDKKPYVQYVAGADYTFREGTYVNFQFTHGFFHERGRDNLNDYFLFRAEKSILDGKLKLALLGGGVAVSDWKALSDNYGFIYTPEIAYRPNDNTEISLGARLINARGKGFLPSLKGKDEVFIKITYNF